MPSQAVPKRSMPMLRSVGFDYRHFDKIDFFGVKEMMENSAKVK